MSTYFLARGIDDFGVRLLRSMPRWTGWLIILLVVCAGYARAQNTSEEYNLALNKIADGNMPAGWSVGATHSSGPLAQWLVGTDAAVPGGTKVLTIDRIQDKSPRVFNLYWTNRVAFQSGELKVRMRANTGSIDQGGGLIWRVTDENNYYVARYNPLENNFRLYFVKDGMRAQIASRENLDCATGQWVNLRIAHNGQRIQGWFNNALAWDVSNAQFLKAGGVGLWTKADAASSFADFVVRTRAK